MSDNDPRDWRKVRVEYGVQYHLSDVRAFARYNDMGNAPWKRIREALRGELANVGQMGVAEQIAEGRQQLEADAASTPGAQQP